MISDIRNQSESSVSSLVTGIVEDAQTLVKQQLELFRTEVRNDFQRTKEALAYLGIGVTLCVPGGIMFCFVLVHLLHELTKPAGTDPAGIPLWLCFAIVTVLCGIPGTIFSYIGIKKFQSFSPLPEQTAQALMENVQWNPTTRPT